MFFNYFIRRLRRIFANKFTLIALTFCFLTQVTKPSAIDKLCKFARQGDSAAAMEFINPENINSTNSQGRTPLECAIMSSWPTFIMLQILLEGGANPNKKDRNGNTPLHYLAMTHITKAKFIERIHLLIDSGADINQKNNAGLTPLNFALTKNHAVMAEFLFENGGFLDILSGSLIHKECPQFLHYLMKKRRSHMRGIKPIAYTATNHNSENNNN